MLQEYRGPFSDVFRAKHPDRRDAYTCWPSSTGAEQFNYGSRIDHILVGGSCLHEDQEKEYHNFVTCHIKECDILTQYKRLKPGNAPRWKGGWSVKLEGSDHVPVYTSLDEIPDIPQHNTPSLASRYLPMIYGFQQTLASVFMKRQAAKQVEAFDFSCSSLDESIVIASCSQNMKRPISACTSRDEFCSSLDQEPECGISGTDEESRGSSDKAVSTSSLYMASESKSSNGQKKKARKGQSSQLTLRSFFTRSSKASDGTDKSASNVCSSQAEIPNSNHETQKDFEFEWSKLRKEENEQSCNLDEHESIPSPLALGEDKLDASSSEKKNGAALLEWQRIRNLMQNSIPLCKGHNEPCVARVVKKPGPTFGRRFYVCSRAEGPSSNPEANCGYFKWASSKFREK